MFMLKFYILFIALLVCIGIPIHGRKFKEPQMRTDPCSACASVPTSVTTTVKPCKPKLSNTRLDFKDNYVVRRVISRNASGCCEQCRNYSDCLSWSYDARKFICTLLDRTEINHVQAKKHKSGVLF